MKPKTDVNVKPIGMGRDVRHTVIQVLPQSVVEHVFVISQQPIGIPVIKRVKVAARTKSGMAVRVCVIINRMRMGIVVSSVRVEVHRYQVVVIVTETAIGTGVVV